MTGIYLDWDGGDKQKFIFYEGRARGTRGAAAIASEIASVYEFDVKHVDSWFDLKLLLSAPSTNDFFDALKYFYGSCSTNVFELTRIKLFITPLYVFKRCKFHRPR